MTYQINPDGSRLTTHEYPSSSFDPSWRTTMVDTYDSAGRITKRVTRPSAADDPLIEDSSYTTGRRIEQRTGGTTPRPSSTPMSGAAAGAVPYPPISDPAAIVRSALRLAESAAEDVVEDAVGRSISFTSQADRLAFTPIGWKIVPPTARRHAWRVEYSPEDRMQRLEIQSVNGGQSRITTFRYDEVGNLIEVVDPDGQVTHYTYDERDSVVEVRTSTGLSGSFEYDDRGSLRRSLITSPDQPGEQMIDYYYDGLRRLRRVTQYPDWPDTGRQRVIEYQYDAEGFPTAFASGP